MRHLGDLNDLYNVQDVILLSEIIENRFETMHKTYGFNPKKCNSASAMSGYIEREVFKIILALPTKLDHVEIFEQTVTGGFSSVNTRLAFDTQILLPNLPKLKPNLDFENNPMNKDFDYKVVYNLKLGKSKTQKKRVISKILKLDENHQSGDGMTKPLPIGCIKDDSDISWASFNFLMETVDFKDTIGHLYIVDIEFDYENATEKMMAYNEIYPPIIEKHKIIDPCERSVFQLLEQYKEGERSALGYKSMSKAHATMLKKHFLPMYLEELAFVIKKVGWKVTKIHVHLTFEQKRFKQTFILMIQNSKQESKNDIEKDFYKLINNSILGYDCRNNLDNCKFVPIFDELKEFTHIERYHNIFDTKISEFVTADLKQNIEATYNDKLIKLDTEDKFYQIQLDTLNTERLTNLEVASSFENKQKKNKRKLTLNNYDDRKHEVLRNQKIKSLIGFDEEYCTVISLI